MRRAALWARNGLYFGFPILLAAMVAYGIAVVQNVSDQFRQIQQDLAKVEGYAQQYHGLEEEGVVEKHLTLEQVEETKKIHLLLDQALTRFSRFDSQSLRLQTVSNEFRLYESALNHEFPHLVRGDVEAAEKVAEDEVDPHFEALEKAIDKANAYYDRKANRINLQADVSTTAVLLASGLLISLFLARFAHSQRTRARQEAEQRQQTYFRALVSNISDIILLLDAGETIQFANETSQSLLGFTPLFLKDKSLLEFVHPEDLNAARDLFQTARQDTGNTTRELRLRDHEETWHYFEVIASNLLSSTDVTGLLVTLRDITDRKAFEEQMTYQARHDVLTHLPNRACFHDRLKESLEQGAQDGSGRAVIFVDLDNFKLINDSLGHEAGDQLLIHVAGCLSQCIGADDMVARLGGDEFTLLLERCDRVEEVIEVAERLVEALHSPIVLAGSEVFTSASIGLAYTYGQNIEPDALLRNADTAMYEAKTNGKAGYVLFESHMNDRVVERMMMETGLRFALERGELCVHYQPLVDLETGYMTGVEALARWQHPIQGLIPPGKFIPIAEETGQIIPIGYWVLAEACRQGKEWITAFPNQRPFTLNVNLSGKQLQQPDVVERVHAVLQETGLPAECLKLEITESVMMADVETTVEKLKQLKALGVKLAIDDFGTGYSSMATLSAFPLDTIKIDRSFISRLSDQAASSSVIAAIIQLSKALNMDVTGEGIETEDQVMQLQWMGCTTGQGYYFARPQPATALDGDISADSKSYVRKRGEADKDLVEQLLRAA